MIMQKAFPTDAWKEKRPLRYFNAINKTRFSQWWIAFNFFYAFIL